MQYVSSRGKVGVIFFYELRSGWQPVTPNGGALNVAVGARQVPEVSTKVFFFFLMCLLIKS